MVPFQSRRLRLWHASRRDAAWLARRMDRECGKLGSRVQGLVDGSLALGWAQDGAPSQL